MIIIIRKDLKKFINVSPFRVFLTNNGSVLTCVVDVIDFWWWRARPRKSLTKAQFFCPGPIFTTHSSHLRIDTHVNIKQYAMLGKLKKLKSSKHNHCIFKNKTG